MGFVAWENDTVANGGRKAIQQAGRSCLCYTCIKKHPCVSAMVAILKRHVEEFEHKKYSGGKKGGGRKRKHNFYVAMVLQ